MAKPEPPDRGGEDIIPDEPTLSALQRASRLTRSTVGTRRAGVLAWLERSRQRNVVVDVGMRLYERDQQAAGTVAGSAVAFRLFLFFVPTLLVVIALAGFAAAHLAPRDVNSAAGITGVVASQIETAFRQPSTTRWTALLFGLVGMFSSGRSLAKTLVLASALSWRAPARQKATLRITAMVVGVMVGVALVASLVNRLRRTAGLAVVGFSFIGAAAAYMLVWLALSLTLPRATKDPGSVLPGAALVGVALTGLQAITQIYIPDKISQASALYGSIGITIVTLGWFFIIGRVATFSMTLNAVVYERLGSITTLVFGLPVLRLLPAKSARFARFFDLPARPQRE